MFLQNQKDNRALPKIDWTAEISINICWKLPNNFIDKSNQALKLRNQRLKLVFVSQLYPLLRHIAKSAPELLPLNPGLIFNYACH